MRFYKWLIMCLAIGCCATSYAVSDSPILAKQLAELQAIFQEAKKTASDVKMVSEEMYEMRDTLDEVYKNYKFVQSLRGADPAYLLTQFTGLTNLHRLGDAQNWEERYLLLHGEVSLRFARPETPAGGPSQRVVHGTLFGIQGTEKEIERINAQLEAIRSEPEQNATDIGTEAQLLAARSELEKKLEKLKGQFNRQQTLLDERDWDVAFTEYLASGKIKKTEAIQESWYLGIVNGVLDPNHVYSNMTKLGIFSNLFFLFLVLFFVFRMLGESFGAAEGKASFWRVLGNAFQSTQGYFLYLWLGIAVFALMLSFVTYLDGYGGISFIHKGLASLRTELLEGGENSAAYDDFFSKLLATTVDVANIGNMGFSWALYQLTSTAYVILSRLVDLAFAVGFAFAWGFGFLAIASRTLPERFDLTPGWMLTGYTLFLWGVIEFALVFIVALVSYGASAYLEGLSGFGVGVSALAVWQYFACIMMFLVLVVRAIAPFMAVMLASQQSAVSALGMIPAATTLMVVNQLVKKLMNGPTPGAATDNNGGRMGLFPSSDGDRRRDSLARGGQWLSSVGNASVGDLFRSGKEAAGNLFTQAASGGDASEAQGSPQGGATPSPSTPSTSTNPQRPSSSGFNSPLYGATSSDNMVINFGGADEATT